MRILGKAFRLLLSGLKKLAIRLWLRHNNSRGNVHLGAEEAQLKTVPFSGDRVYLRPTASDSSRVLEFLEGIYCSDSYLHTAVTRLEPKVLVDVGANIGLSSLNLLKAFSSVRSVIGIEAEKNNFEVLCRNYRLWSEQYPQVDFTSIHGAATASSTSRISAEQPLHDPAGQSSASGTFRFLATDQQPVDGAPHIAAVSVAELLGDYDGSDGIVVKIDIEGGEQYLMERDTAWLEKVAFLTVEIHDRYDESMFQSSRNLFRALNEYDFAIAPEKDVLHCYARHLLRI